MYKKILYPALAIFTAWFFAEGIPVATFESASTFLSLLGAIVFCVLVVMSLFQFALKKPEEPSENAQAEGCMIMLLILVSLFGYGAFLVYHGIERTKNELKEHGIFTIATIKDGSSFKTRRFDDTELTVTFKNKNGETTVATVEISASQFDKYYKDQEVPVVYSERYPSIVKILEGNEDMNEYANEDFRDINLKDLKTIFELTTPKNINNYLNKLGPEWKYERSYTDSSDTYVNEIKQSGIKISGNEITYMLPGGADSKAFDKDALSQGFEKIEGDKNDIAGRLSQERLFVNKDYMLVIRYQTIMPERNGGVPNYETVEVPRSIGVVTLIKQ
ncbi:hypothetical protein ACLI09_09450 [Flavobacterium sp. RHBU_24]|uniref:hypothetical protein n=1 Tax=Flavobacterium sp. RHBU_24 TaxID=3391185 RepID=UPI0039854C40